MRLGFRSRLPFLVADYCCCCRCCCTCLPSVAGAREGRRGSQIGGSYVVSVAASALRLGRRPGHPGGRGACRGDSLRSRLGRDLHAGVGGLTHPPYFFFWGLFVHRPLLLQFLWKNLPLVVRIFCGYSFRWCRCVMPSLWENFNWPWELTCRWMRC